MKAILLITRALLMVTMVASIVLAPIVMIGHDVRTSRTMFEDAVHSTEATQAAVAEALDRDRRSRIIGLSICAAVFLGSVTGLTAITKKEQNRWRGEQRLRDRMG